MVTVDKILSVIGDRWHTTADVERRLGVQPGSVEEQVEFLFRSGFLSKDVAQKTAMYKARQKEGVLYDQV